MAAHGIYTASRRLYTAYTAYTASSRPPHGLLTCPVVARAPRRGHASRQAPGHGPRRDIRVAMQGRDASARAGMDAFLTKPLAPATLRALVESLPAWARASQAARNKAA
jgi:CheY-like chemotaxis protein